MVYQPWVTEHVEVVEGGDFIGFQYLLVMSFLGEDGAVQGPFVTKYWQDARFEEQDLHTYRGSKRCGRGAGRP